MKKYEDEVARLERQLDRAGVTLNSLELRDSVAALHGHHSWADLEESSKRGFGQWLKKRLVGECPPQPIRTLGELAKRVQRDSLYMGRINDEINPREVWSPYLLRHMLIAGKEGWGPWTFIQFLVSQHILRGGGVILFNSYEDPDLKETMEQAARLAGRSEAFQSRYLDTQPASGNTLEGNEILHISVPLMRQGTTAQFAAHAYLRQFWAAASETGNRRVPSGPPFLLVIPNAEVLMTAEWETWYLHARKFGVGVVVSAQSIPTLRRHNPDIAQIVVENSCTKVMLHAPSEQALDEAVGCIETTCSSSPESAEIRKVLKGLGMGEAVFATLDDYQHLRIPMLHMNKNRHHSR